jgi:hypothetical protein
MKRSQLNPSETKGAPRDDDPRGEGATRQASWRKDHNRKVNGSQVDRIVALATANNPSVDFCD